MHSSVITFSQIYFKKLACYESGREIHHVGERVGVWNCDILELTILTAWLPKPIRLPYKVERRRPRAACKPDYPVRFHLHKLCLGGSELLNIQPTPETAMQWAVPPSSGDALLHVKWQAVLWTGLLHRGATPTVGRKLVAEPRGVHPASMALENDL